MTMRRGFKAPPFCYSLERFHQPIRRGALGAGSADGCGSEGAGAAIGAGIGAGIYSSREEAFKSYKPESLTEPEKNNEQHEELYGKWKVFLEKNI